MKFNKIVEKLQEENKGYVVLIKCGIFFNAIGKDAVVLSEMFGLNVICFYENVCKCGIPIGNYTSQIFANIYLNEIDQYIKHYQKN